jgi:hypothetical protein
MAIILMIRSRVNFLSTCKVVIFHCFSNLSTGVYCMPVENFETSVNPKSYTGEAESGLERLHQCAEKDLEKILPNLKPDAVASTPSLTAFSDFRMKLAGLTRY